MDINSTEFAKALDKIIEQKINIILADKLKNQHGIMKGWNATVSSINGDGTINVTLPGNSAIYPNLKNKSGVTLSISDEVYLISISTLSNAYIGEKK